MRTTLLAAALASAAVVPSGCGGPPDHVLANGRVVKGGAAFVVPEDQSLRMTFLPADGKGGPGRMYAASVNRAAGTFSVPGLEGYGIPRGRYKVEVVLNPRSGKLTGKEKVGRQRVNDDTDFLKGRFAGNATPFAFDIPDAAELTIDLDKPGAPEAKVGGPAPRVGGKADRSRD